MMRHLPLLLLAGCAGPLILSLSGGGSAELPPEYCSVLLEPTSVACESVGGRVAVGGKAVAMCRFPTGSGGPDRWTIIDEAGRAITVYGGDCFTAVKGY